MKQGTMHNQESFLNTISKNLGRERRTEGVERPRYKQQPQHDVLKGAATDELIEVLKTQCQEIHTDLLETNLEHLEETILQAMGDYGADRAVAWDDPRFEEYGLSRFLQRPDMTIWGSAPDEENIKISERADVGITFSDYTLAESGTVVLMNGGGKGQSVSLLPTYYIALIPTSTLVPRITQATEAIHQRVEAGERIPSCINFVTGPSNSADIEMNLVVGVHGPVRACYILIHDC
ncbi:LutC/YkgG family protein [Shouchella shacheensis]|uniref:LutC/YkgG family protein n=1 Tax=Shouchella shacheensis TaxID=1649580 RepID=UPI00073FF2F8|nr:lactate utilization protein C [Shouchella shacheensis]